LGRRWAQARLEARDRFPGLKLKPAGNLHLTVVFVGKGWRERDLDRLRTLARLPLDLPVELVPQVARVGRYRQVVAVDLEGLPEAVQAQVVAAKQTLVAEGLKSPDAHDGTFRPHVTLAESRKPRPTPGQLKELAEFEDWVASRLELAALRVRLDGETPTLLLLAGAARPDPGSGSDYLEVGAFLGRIPHPGPFESRLG
jgi:2'-5' RNA ligase